MPPVLDRAPTRARPYKVRRDQWVRQFRRAPVLMLMTLVRRVGGSLAAGRKDSAGSPLRICSALIPHAAALFGPRE